MRRSAHTLENLIAAHPERHAELRPFLVRARRYREECGCQLGGIFLAAAFIFAIAYQVITPAPSLLDWIRQIALSLLVVFVISVVGKIFGIAIARVKLTLLHRSAIALLAARHQPEVTDVHVHQVGRSEGDHLQELGNEGRL